MEAADPTLVRLVEGGLTAVKSDAQVFCRAGRGGPESTEFIDMVSIGPAILLVVKLSRHDSNET